MFTVIGSMLALGAAIAAIMGTGSFAIGIAVFAGLGAINAAICSAVEEFKKE